MPTNKKSPTSKSKSRRAPWKKPAPKSSRHTRLTKGQKAKARSAARRAGRSYPNLVDNMRVAAKGKTGKGKRRGKQRGKG